MCGTSSSKAGAVSPSCSKIGCVGFLAQTPRCTLGTRASCWAEELLTSEGERPSLLQESTGGLPCSFLLVLEESQRYRGVVGHVHVRSGPGPSSPATARTYNQMLEAGVPKAAVRRRSVAMGVKTDEEFFGLST